MTEEKSVTFTEREIAVALAWWMFKDKSVYIPDGARLTLVKGKPYRAASATLTWKA